MSPQAQSESELIDGALAFTADDGGELLDATLDSAATARSCILLFSPCGCRKQDETV